MSYENSIKDWHRKAKEGDDYFVRFILEYISFIVLVNKTIPGRTDRPKIQSIKRNEELKENYLMDVEEQVLPNLKDCLDVKPLLNVTREEDKYWDFDADWQPTTRSPNDGTLRSTEDFMNIIEFIYRARNNLFHGHKTLNYPRDATIVRYGYKLLKPLMKVLLAHENVQTLLLTDYPSKSVRSENSGSVCPYCNKILANERGRDQHVSACHSDEIEDSE